MRKINRNFITPLDVLAMRHNIDSIAVAVIVLYVFMGVLSFPFVRELVGGNDLSTIEIRQSSQP